MLFMNPRIQCSMMEYPMSEIEKDGVTKVTADVSQDDLEVRLMGNQGRDERRTRRERYTSTPYGQGICSGIFTGKGSSKLYIPRERKALYR